MGISEKLTIAHIVKTVKNLDKNDLLKTLAQAGLRAENESTPLSKEQQAAILQYIRNKKKTDVIKPKKKLSLSKKESPTGAQKTHTPSDLDNIHRADRPIISLDNKFKKTHPTPTPAKKLERPKATKKAPVEQAQPKALSVEEVLAERAKKQAIATEQPTSIEENNIQQKSSITTTIEIPSRLTIAELAEKTHKKPADIIKAFFDLGEMVTINQIIPFEMAEIALETFQYKAKLNNALDQANTEAASQDDILEETGKEDIRPRAAVVTIMGHVDHGKTTLLDTIRRSKITEKESGGITQHIGAYQVDTKHGPITFLDTPGHEAFSAMRARGSKITDIIILVVAANDGVMPQTKEAIQHAKEAKVPIIVAVNKIDKDDADPEKIRTELSKEELIPEEWGGDTIFQNISAKAGTNIETLLESIALQAEVLELKANYLAQPSGIIIESRVDKGLGSVATVLVQSGTFKRGDCIIAGEQYGKIRNMHDDLRKTQQQAGPSVAVEITGLASLPNAGDQVVKVKNERKARDIAQQRQTIARIRDIAQAKKLKNEAVVAQLTTEGTEKKFLKIILKADVHGSLEAIKGSIAKANHKEGAEVHIEIVDSSVGAITTSDIMRAKTAECIIIGFNVRADSAAKKAQAQESTQIEYFSIIYALLDFLEDLALGMQEPKKREVIIGTAEVKEVFRSSKFGTIAGCLVIEGVIRRKAGIRVLRNQKVIFEGTIDSLRRFNDNVEEVKNAIECGIGVTGYSDIKNGDHLEAYTIELVPPQRKNS